MKYVHQCSDNLSEIPKVHTGDATDRILTPTAFGADPTGHSDASSAMAAAVKAFTALGVGTTDQVSITQVDLLPRC